MIQVVTGGNGHRWGIVWNGKTSEGKVEVPPDLPDGEYDDDDPALAVPDEQSDPGPDEVHRWVTIKGRPVFIGDKGGGGGGGGGGGNVTAPKVSVDVQQPAMGSVAPSAKRMAKEAEEALKVKLPPGATDGLQKIDVMWESDRSTIGTYKTLERRIVMNYNASRTGDKNPKAGEIVAHGREVLHELGHHVHLNLMTGASAQAWANLSRGGTNCRISSYGRNSGGEHFAEVFKNYALGGKSRTRVQRLEPRSYSFMRKLWSKPPFEKVKDHRPQQEINDRYYGLGSKK